MTKPLLTCCAILIGIATTFAQSKESIEVNKITKSVIIEEINIAARGTFQLIFVSENTTPIGIDEKLLMTIEENRKKSETYFMSLTKDVVIKIYSFNEIQNENFISLKEEFIVDSELVAKYSKL